MKIIDCHVHINQYELMKDISSLEERLEKLQCEMEENSVDYAIILSSYKVNENRPSTYKIIEAIKKYDNLGVAAGFSLDFHTDEDFIQYRRLVQEGKIKALKIYAGYEHYYPYDERYQRLYDLCVAHDIPVMVHTGDTYSETAKLRFARPIHLDEVAVENPELKIVMCHVGNPWLQEAQEVIYKNKNMYADISGLVIGDFDDYFERIMRDKIKEMFEYAKRPRYFLYGTDWPISSMKSYLDFVKDFEIEEQDRKLLMYENAKNLFNIDI